MRKKDRVRLARGLMLGMTTLCTAALFGAAGNNAAMTFAGGAAAVVQAEQGVLRGLCVALDAGHGGYDGGAVGRVSGEAEKGLNLDVAIRTKRLLEEQGAQVIMTRTGDYALCDENPPIRKKLQDMQRRARIIGEGRADIVVSIHMNEYAGRSESGPQVFYREGCPAGRLLAGAVQEAMVEGLRPAKAREALGGDYYILTLGLPSVLVECGFLSNREEEAKLLTEAYREQVAAAIADGLCRWHALAGEKPEPLEAVDRRDEPTGDA
ncbi:MAG: N-acetylmuramoyl-L-alanine amidase [Clostridia bacterium]|nr:N-acetylmuramoyl-L-alanine amidase [Clostridia bacterium]MBQ2948788.1 N-acetylmuramoyl-L-alanine amidase [Clostridia bacterium]MBQ4608548.1 N-acetylmuramoyl-L-alanine amidase [Clostridia bacterium]MBQ6859763.1 N-acetylmuramoyl-L-alanine amidase [Clostridia bacterium]MBQ7053505.1 N-acetylmuramoyl-L-alanine amidase [Clostridia bacterium]